MICQIFHLAYKLQQNFTIGNGVKTLELHHSLVLHELFPTHKHGCHNGGRNLKFSAKKLFSSFRVVKNKLPSFCPPP